MNHWLKCLKDAQKAHVEAFLQSSLNYSADRHKTEEIMIFYTFRNNFKHSFKTFSKLLNRNVMFVINGLKCLLPDGFLLPAEDVLEWHLLPEQPLLLDVEVAGCKVLKVCQSSGWQSWVNAGWHWQGWTWSRYILVKIDIILQINAFYKLLSKIHYIFAYSYVTLNSAYGVFSVTKATLQSQMLLVC